MSTFTVGEINWDEGDVKEGGPKTEFLKIDANSKARVRIMGNPNQYYIHWVDTKEGKKRKINSPIQDPALVRRLEEMGFKKSARWIVKVLDRSDEKFKLLEIGSQIYANIKALYEDEDWRCSKQL